MNRKTQGTVIVFILCTLIGQTMTIGAVQILSTFSRIFNGDYNNEDQVANGTTVHDYIRVIVKPLILPFLNGFLAAYLEESINGIVYRMHLVEFSIGPRLTIYAIPSNFTDPSQYTPGSYNTAELYYLRRQDLQTDEACIAAFEMITPGVYAMNWPDCTHKFNRKHPFYTGTLTCHAVYVTPPLTSKEKFALEPYTFKAPRVRFPVLGEDNICGN